MINGASIAMRILQPFTLIMLPLTAYGYLSASSDTQRSVGGFRLIAEAHDKIFGWGWLPFWLTVATCILLYQWRKELVLRDLALAEERKKLRRKLEEFISGGQASMSASITDIIKRLQSTLNLRLAALERELDDPQLWFNVEPGTATVSAEKPVVLSISTERQKQIERMLDRTRSESPQQLRAVCEQEVDRWRKAVMTDANAVLNKA
jgi:hypothetical protein